MKISKDGMGKHIIDFEGLEVQVDTSCAVNELFNPKTVSTVCNGSFNLNPKQTISEKSGTVSNEN